MPLADPDVELVFAEIGYIGQQLLDLVVQGLAAHDPTHVRPVAAIAGAVRVAGLVSELVMHTVRRHPEDRSALERQCRANGEEVLKPFGTLEAAMRQQAMIAEADAKAARYPIQKQTDEECFPAKHKQRRQGADMEGHHKAGSYPINAFVLSNHETPCWCECSVPSSIRKSHGKTNNFAGNAL